MVTLLLSYWFLSGLQEGDHWRTERTMQFVQPDGHVDVTNIDRLSYRVLRVEAKLFAIQTETAPGKDSPTKPSSVVMTFKSGGVLASVEDTSDLNLERIRRMEWTAVEQRKGIEWSRNWPASSNLIEAKVLVKPTARTLKDTTLLVTYKEGSLTKAVATIKVFNEVPVIEDLALTINQVAISGSAKPGSLIVTEKLKEIHMGSS